MASSDRDRTVPDRTAAWAADAAAARAINVDPAGWRHNGWHRAFTGSVSPPVLLWKTEPEYSEEARKAKVQGTVILRIEVDARGQAQAITVERSLGLGLDDRAVEAVRRWKFKPGIRMANRWSRWPSSR